MGFKFKLSNEVPFIAEWTIFEAALKAVPSNNNQVPIVVPNATLPAELAVFTTFQACHIVRASLYFWVNWIAFSIFFAKFNHLSHFAATPAQRRATAIAAHHTHHVTTATATVITISVMISHANFAFSSLRFQNQYHLISL